MSYTWRSLTAADTAAWSELTAAIAEAEGIDEQYSAEDLAEELEDPSLDPARDTVAVLADDGTLVAYGQAVVPAERFDGEIRAMFFGGVHPEHTGQGIGSELLQRLERRVVEWSAELFPGHKARPQSTSASPETAALFQANGYRPVRYFHVMAHDLAALGTGADDRLQDYDAALDEQVRAAHIDAFAKHWGSAPPDDERWQHWYTGSRSFRPGCSTMSVGPDGAVEGYLLAYEFQPGELWFGQVGVRPRARGTALGRAMLCRALAAAADAGYTRVKLDVDSDNSAGAGRLYESAGFVRERTTVSYQR
ncbi:MAG: GNAT family N-acetyltransferase [Pseudonocardiales bacterium]